MRKAMLAVMVAGSAFALTAAGATGFSLDIGADQTVKANSTGATTFTLAQCQDVFSLYYVKDATGITGVRAFDQNGVTAELPQGSPSAQCKNLQADAAFVLSGGSDTATADPAQLLGGAALGSASYHQPNTTPGSEAPAYWEFTFNDPFTAANSSHSATMTMVMK
jgi:hypothetical protein